jgi:hypothetical protein
MIHPKAKEEHRTEEQDDIPIPVEEPVDETPTPPEMWEQAEFAGEPPLRDPAWKVADFRVQLVGGQTGEVFLKLIHTGEAMKALFELALGREAELRQRVRELVQECPEHELFLAARANETELEKQRREVLAVIADVDRQLRDSCGDLSSEQLTALLEKDVEAKVRQQVLDRALGHVRRERDRRAIALNAVAVAIAEKLRAEAMADVDRVEKAGADLFKVAGDRLDALVLNAVFGGGIRGYNWAQTVIDQFIPQLLGGPVPSLPLPLPPAAPVELGDPFALRSNSVLSG